MFAITSAFRVVLGCAIIAAVAMMQTACSRQDKSSKRNIVLYVTLTTGNPFYEEMIAGLKAGIGNHRGWELQIQTGATADDASGQSQIMDSYLKRSQSSNDANLVGVILVPANSSTALTSVIKSYNRAGVPVINVDIPIDEYALTATGAKIDAFIGSNNISGSKKAGIEMGSQLKRNGTVLLLMGVPGQASTRDRKSGFIDGLMEVNRQNGLDVTVIEWTANWNRSEALTAVESVLSSRKNVEGIFAENDLMALGAAGSKTLLNLKPENKPVIIGYDAIPEARDAVLNKGTLHATVSQNPFKIGTEAISVLSKIKSGEPIQKRTEIETSLISKKPN